MALIYHKMFTPKEITQYGEFKADHSPSETQLRIFSDYEHERERAFTLPLIENPGSCINRGDDISIEIRLGNALVPNKRDPFYVMISDGQYAIGFKISESGPIKGAECIPDKLSLDSIRLSGDDSETASLSASGYPHEFHITLKPEQNWGTIFCAQGNGTMQCVDYNRKPDLTKGVYFELYRDKPKEEYIINYVEVTIYRNGLASQCSKSKA